MLKALKWVLVVFTLLLFLCVFAVSVFLPYYDYNRLKPQISQFVLESTGRQLTIHGNLEFKIGLEPTLLVSDICFQNAAWGSRPDLADIKRFELQLALWPLLKGEIDVRRCVLVNPDILVETDQNGNTNLDLNWAKPKTSRVDKEESTRIWKLNVKELRIKGGSLVFLNGQSGKNYRLGIEQLQLASFRAQRPAYFQGRVYYNQIPFDMAGEIEPPREADWGYGPWKIALDLKSYLAVANVSGFFKGRPNRQGVDLNFSLQTPELAHLRGLTGYKLPHSGPVEISGCIRRIEVAEDPVGPPAAWEFSLMAKIREAAVNLDGMIQNRKEHLTMDFDFSIAGEDATRTFRLKGIGRALQEPFQIRGHVNNQDPQTVHFSRLQAQLGENDMQGSLTLQHTQKPMRVKAQLSSNRIDLRPYVKRLSKKEQTECLGNRENPCMVFSHTPFRIVLPEHFETACELRINQLIFPQLLVQKVKATVVQKKKSLHIRLANSAVSGGSLNGLLFIKPEDAGLGLALELKGRNLQLGRMPQDLHFKQVIEGQIDVDARLQGQGQSMAEWMSSLAGHTILIMKTGRINNKYIGLLGTDLATGLFTLFNQEEDQEGFTSVQCLVSRFDIQKGLAEATVLVLNTPSVRIAGQGTVNFANEELNLKLRPLPKKGIGLKGVGRISLGLGSLAKSFKLGGVLAKPTLTLDPAQTFINVGKIIGGTAAFGLPGLAMIFLSSNLDDARACEKAIQLSQQEPKKSKPPDIPRINDK